jgi:hypothetical protein
MVDEGRRPNLRIYVSADRVDCESELAVGTQIHALSTVLHKLLHMQEGLGSANSIRPTIAARAPAIGRKVDGQN